MFQPKRVAFLIVSNNLLFISKYIHAEEILLYKALGDNYFILCV